LVPTGTLALSANGRVACGDALTVGAFGAGIATISGGTLSAGSTLVGGISLGPVDGRCFGRGDPVIGVNPATESVDKVGTILRGLDRLIEATGAPTQACCLAHITTPLACLLAEPDERGAVSPAARPEGYTHPLEVAVIRGVLRVSPRRRRAATRSACFAHRTYPDRAVPLMHRVRYDDVAAKILRPGLHRAATLDVATLEQQAREAGCATFVLPVGIVDRASFFDGVRSVLPLDPPVLGSGSWDGLDDSLWEGLHELPQRRILILWPNAQGMVAADLHMAICSLSDVATLLADPDATVGNPKDVTVLVEWPPAREASEAT